MPNDVDIAYRKKMLRFNVVNSHFDKSVMGQFYEVVDEFFLEKLNLEQSIKIQT
ncbi:hypothetical protein [Francisella salina]|uniref:Uncharacterized protein n=1 Tax=Francisella salina TaxID=573569 RepID=A0ABM5MCL3_FRAST|nr:hypothetical protein [Francisella salina]AEI36814.1 hypothetical protein F7308_1890 [Francisella salina]